jgi:hypothetical protein
MFLIVWPPNGALSLHAEVLFNLLFRSSTGLIGDNEEGHAIYDF